jgi:hypothetical protein
VANTEFLKRFLDKPKSVLKEASPEQISALIEILLNLDNIVLSKQQKKKLKKYNKHVKKVTKRSSSLISKKRYLQKSLKIFLAIYSLVLPIIFKTVL